MKIPAHGFSLVFPFAGIGPSLQLATWLDERLTLQRATLQRQEAPSTFVDSPEAFVDALMARVQDFAAAPGAVLVWLQRHPHDEKWNTARRVFLARLNERRFLLERDLARPLVLVLPADFRPEVRNIAPDIWHVRALSEELHAAAAAAPVEGVARPAPPATRAKATSAPTPAFDEWRRAMTTAAPEQLNMATAWRAVTELLDAGRPSDADAVAREAALIARNRVRADSSGPPESLRDLSISLNNVGQVAQAQSNWAEAGAAYRESLALARQLVERLGRTPESLDDLAESLINVGRLSDADAALLDEARSIYRTLVDRYPDVARYREQLDTLTKTEPGPAPTSS